MTRKKGTMKNYTKLFEEWKEREEWDDEAALAYEVLMGLSPLEIGSLVLEDPQLLELTLQEFSKYYTDDEVDDWSGCKDPEEIGTAIVDNERIHSEVLQNYADGLAGMGMFNGLGADEVLEVIKGLM